MNNISYDVRVYTIDTYTGKTVTTYWVRWKVSGDRFKEPFRHSAQADSFRSELISAARKGEAFDTETGRPTSWQRAANELSWYEFACQYADMKWKTASAKYRADIARALIAATPAMIPEGKPGRPSDAVIRKALRGWGFNSRRRAEAPEEFSAALAWLSRNTTNVSTLANAGNARKVLNSAITLVSGKPAAASTAKRNRTIICNALDYAIELGAVNTTANPIRVLKWKAPKNSSSVDRRSVVNPKQARSLLAAVETQRPSGPRIKAFFGTIYYAGLRPEEAIELGEQNLTLPPRKWNEETSKWETPPDSDGWGALTFETAAPDAGRAWTDDGDQRDRRQLKHRARGEVRTVPMHPELVALLRFHIEEFGTSPDGKLFTGVRGGELATVVSRRAWIAARKSALTAEQQKSPLARRIYDLRHAALSTWLNAGVAPTQVAEWAGHSVRVLLDIYAKCIDGQQDIAKRRIADALRDDGQEEDSTGDLG
jgi:integrase